MNDIKNVILSGEVFSKGENKIFINDEDRVEFWTSLGGKSASLFHIDLAIEEFEKEASDTDIPEGAEDKKLSGEPGKVNQSVVPENSDGDVDLNVEEEDNFPEHEQMDIQYMSLGDGTNPVPEYNRMAKSKIVDTFKYIDPHEDYRKARNMKVSKDLLKDIADPELWAAKHSDKKPLWVVEKTAGPRIKENWGDYSRDLEAESAQDLYHLVRALGQDDPYDWEVGPTNLSNEPDMGLDVMNPGVNPPMDEGQDTITAVDESAKKYWKKYFKDYGDALTKGDTTKDRLEEKKEDKKEAQQAPPMPNPPGGAGGPPQPPKSAPGAPGGAPGAPGGAPGGPGAPGAPGGAPGAPGLLKSPNLEPEKGDGSNSLELLGWTLEDVNLMDPEDKQKVIEHQIKKPGATPKGPGKGPGMGMGPGKGPGMPPQAPQEAPGEEMGLPVPSPDEQPKQSAYRYKAQKFVEAKLAYKKAQQALNGPMDQLQSPQQPGVDPAAPGGVAPEKSPVADEFSNNDGMDTKAMDIFEQVKMSNVDVVDSEMVPLQKMEILSQRLSTELGMSVDEFVSRIGLNNKSQLLSYFK